jgi:hypothetical protein
MRMLPLSHMEALFPHRFQVGQESDLCEVERPSSLHGLFSCPNALFRLSLGSHVGEIINALDVHVVA